MLYYTWKDLRLIRKSYIAAAGIEGIEPQKIEEMKTSYFLAGAMGGSLVGYLASSIFISTLYYPSYWIMTAFVVALRNTTIGNGGTDLNHKAIPTRKLDANQL